MTDIYFLNVLSLIFSIFAVVTVIETVVVHKDFGVNCRHLNYQSKSMSVVSI